MRLPLAKFALGESACLRFGGVEVVHQSPVSFLEHGDLVDILALLHDEPARVLMRLVLINCSKEDRTASEESNFHERCSAQVLCKSTHDADL